MKKYSAKNIAILVVATCLGLGYSPIFPGTCAALLGVAIYLPVAYFTPPSIHFLLLAIALLVVSIVTIALGKWAEEFFEEKDSGIFTTDEVAGFLFTVLLFRVSDPMTTVLWAFPFTRVIDMIKVPPAKRLEKLPAGWGVLADDLMASIYAAGILHGLLRAFPQWF